MSYSDYGSYNWSKEKNGQWKFRPEFEDRSLVSPQAERKLEAVFGLKFDAVLQSEENEKKYKDLPSEVRDTHHSVIGDLEGFAVVSYKGSPSVLWKGVLIDQIAHEDVSNVEWVDGNEIEKENFVPKVIERSEGNCFVKVLIDQDHNYRSVAYIKNGDEEFLSMCGYGLGEHWWLDEDGDELDWGNKDESKQSEKKFPRQHWPREKECLKRALMLLELK